jgi:molybdate transport system substrate-binding protein
VKPVLFAALLLPVALTACSTNNDDATNITVSAAASLTDAFNEIGEEFEGRNPNITVRFNFAGSSTLAEQINAGAPVDVFAAASLPAMEKAISALDEPVFFASNSLAIAVPPGNPADVNELGDLSDSDVVLVVCDAPVPCGAAADTLFEQNGLTITPASLEPDVRAVLTKVITDEADAGVVYRTDIAAAGDQVEQVMIPDALNVTNQYPIATTVDATSGSQEFIDFVLSDAGQQILAKWGFGSP